MSSSRGSIVVTLAMTAGLLVVGAIGFAWSGLYNVGADAPHTEPVYAALEVARERSIATRAKQLQVPADLASDHRVIQGAGNYAAMCVGCHLAPGMEETELSRGLYPKPPNLSRHRVDPAQAFWVIKHGIKASGMPAWGVSMQDMYIWNMSAFLQKLPNLEKASYDSLVAQSGGHEHGGGETSGHAHQEKRAEMHGQEDATSDNAHEHSH